jgi:two-component system nitrate/nitrite response regulator NarL
MELTAFCAAPEEVTGMLREHQPEVLLVDPGTGIRPLFEMLPAIPMLSPSTRVVLWDEHLSGAERRLALGLGVRRIVGRNVPVSRLLEELRSVALGGDTPSDAEEVARRGARRLTAREREVAQLVCTGLKNREIAERMGITSGTVKVHLMHVFEKTGLRGRHDLSHHAARWFVPEAEAAVQEPGIQ